MSSKSPKDLIIRFRKWVILAIVFCVLLYMVAIVTEDYDKIKNELSGFAWWTFGAAILLTLSNYVLRFVKWHFLCRRLAVKIGWQDNGWNFFAGLSMAISPGKAGELLKPYVLLVKTGTPMATTIPALITERLTDGIAMLILMFGGLLFVSTDQTDDYLFKIVIAGGVIAAGLVVLSSKTISLGIIRLLEKIPAMTKITPKLKEMYQSMRTCVAPISLVWTIFLSLLAWAAECLAYYFLWLGIGVKASMGACFFIYAVATLFGIPAPGGVGPTDAALYLLPETLGIVGEGSGAQITFVTILTRFSTMWFGVGLGAFALIRVSQMLGGSIEISNDEANS